MFSRANLKQKGLEAFKRNYWACVVVALLIGLVSGSGGSGGGNSFSNISKKYTNNNSNSYNLDLDDLDLNDLNHGDTSAADTTGLLAVLGVLGGLIIVIVMIALVVGIAFSVFVANPLLVGCKRYFTINSYEKPLFGEVGFGFKKGNYLNIVKVEFMKNLFIFLWSLLLIIPGIIKAYEYYLVDYILSEDPSLSYKDALEQSKNMMDGYKMDTFVLELSFIGWGILSILTCGILGIFYVNPYMYATFSELFLFIREKRFPGAAPYYTPSFAGAYGNVNPQFNQGQQFTPQQPQQQYTPQQPTQQYNAGQQYTPQQPAQQFDAGQQYNPDQQYNAYTSQEPTAPQEPTIPDPTDFDPNSYYNQ